jgi:hypothetical protein
LAALLLLAATAGAFLVANARSRGKFVYERVPADRRPLDLYVDTDPVPDVVSPIVITQQMMDRWSIVPGTEDLFGTARAGGSYNGATAKQTFGVFTNSKHEVAFDSDGTILAAYGLSTGVLGITLKVVDASRGEVRDVLVVINTQPGALNPPAGSGATKEDLFRGTLLHELGHILGVGHSAVGMTNSGTPGLLPAAASQIPTMYPFRLPFRPQEGSTLEVDDQAAVRFRYANRSIGRGSISGTVRSLSGAPINQIAVRAVGPGTAFPSHVGILTDGDSAGLGRFTIPDLPPGSYRVLIETINGRGGVDAGALAASSGPLGSNPFVLARDEFWEPGDTYDPGVDDPFDSAFVHVRAERDTGGVDFVINAAPIVNGQSRGGALANGDARVPDESGNQHYTDLYVFEGRKGDSVTLRATTSGFTPQIRLYRPSDLGLEREDAPTFGRTATLVHTLKQSGAYTVAVAARGQVGTSTGGGTYSLSLTGSGTALTPAPSVVGPSIEVGADGGDFAVGSPSCDVTMLRLTARAGTHEELWIDQLVVRGSGTGNERDHVTAVRLAVDSNANGQHDTGEPVVGSTTFGSDNGTAVFNDLGLEFDPGTVRSLLVTYSVDVPNPGVPLGAHSAWALLLLLPLLLVRRHARAAAIIALALLPIACGGGSSPPDPPCFTAFRANVPAWTFEAQIRPGDVVASGSVGAPPPPLGFPASTVASSTLTVSQRP